MKKIKFSTHYEENKIFYTLGFFLSKKSKKDYNSPSENEKKHSVAIIFLIFSAQTFSFSAHYLFSSFTRDQKLCLKRGQQPLGLRPRGCALFLDTLFIPLSLENK